MKQTRNDKLTEMIGLYRSKINSKENQKELAMKVSCQIFYTDFYDITPEQYKARANEILALVESRKICLDKEYSGLKLPFFSGRKIKSEVKTLDYVIDHCNRAIETAEKEKAKIQANYSKGNYMLPSSGQNNNFNYNFQR